MVVDGNRTYSINEDPQWNFGAEVSYVIGARIEAYFSATGSVTFVVPLP